MENQNPLLKEWKTPYRAIPFDQIESDHFLPALEAALAEARSDVEAISTNSEEPDFENTTIALESIGERLEEVSGCYFNLFSAEADEKLQSLAEQISADLTHFQNDLYLDDALFFRVHAVWQRVESGAIPLEGEDLRLAELQHIRFVRNGALLSPEEKERLRAIDNELATLWPRFSQNLLKATNGYELLLSKPEELAGLPESALAQAREAAAAKEKPEGSYLFTLQAPSVIPFLTYARNRELRRQISLAFRSRAYGGEFDNSGLLRRIAELRHDRADLLGYATHADFVLEERMARTPAEVESFLQHLLDKALPKARQELAELEALAREDQGEEFALQPHDVAFYSERLKQRRYSIDQEALRPWFRLDAVVEGIFAVATKLFGVRFVREESVPVYHEEVGVYRVEEESSGELIGLFYTDFFPRETKKSGAWMTHMREQGSWYGQVERPHVGIVCNFTRPGKDRPSLLTFDEVETLFHEFGHALHGLFSDCRHRSLSGTNVYWDFVELPSQLFENWASERETLLLFARHYQTGEPLADEIIERLREARRFMTGWATVRQISFGLLDMAWHGHCPQAGATLESIESAALTATRLLPETPNTNLSCSFAHIFAGGYSAGYYSYKWAEVLDADAFEAFREAGLFDRATALRLRDKILARGNSAHPMDLYVAFRGREPDPEALLRRDGLI